MTQEKKLKIASEDERLVGGEVYIPGVPDSDGEFMDAVGIKEMAYKFMKNMRLKKIDVSHNNRLVNEACVVESYIARKGDPDFVEGSWVVVVHVPDDETWGRIKKGEINGFSMEAMVSKEPTILEFDAPPVITGSTQKSEDGHEHEFHVAYDEAGNFLGGKTNIVNNHYHEIRKGTITEPAGSDDHKHRFSHIDVLKQASDGAVVEKADISGTDLSSAGKKLPEERKLGRRLRLSDFCQVP